MSVISARARSRSSRRRTSLCEAHRAFIEAALERGLTAQRIHQDLCAEHAFTASYESVKRFVRRVGAVTQLPFRRMECAPGEEMQVDFGQGAWIEADGRRRRPHLFRAVLSHSRKGYSEVVWRQDTEKPATTATILRSSPSDSKATSIGPRSILRRETDMA